MTAEVLNESVDDVTSAVVVWLRPLYADGHVADFRLPGDPLPFILVNQLPGNEKIEESTAEELVSIHVLTHKAAGRASSRDETRNMHRRMLLLGRYLEDIVFSDGRIATVDFVDVSESPHPEDYGDEQILRRVGRYRIGLSYA